MTRRKRWPLLGIHPLADVKAAYVRYVVDATRGNISEAAKLLKVQRYTVRRALNGSGKP